MNRRRRAALLLALGCLAAGAPAASLPPPRDRWVEVRTDRFTIFSDAAPRRALEVGRSLERFRRALLRATGGADADPPLPIHVYAFRSDASFRPYRLGADGRPGDQAGYFLASPFGSYIAIDAGSEDSLATMYHEYVHQLTHASLSRLPVWLHEGLAEFYSTYRETRGRVEIGHPIEDHLSWLALHPMLPLAELFATADATSHDEADRRGTFYAQSWALVHYLAAGDPSRRTSLGPFLAALDRGEEEARALEEAFGLSPAELERELDRYVRRGRFLYYWMPEEEADLGEESARPMERVEALYRLADLLVHRRPVQGAALAAHLDAGRALDPGYAGLEVVAGIAAAAEGDRAAAARHYARTVVADPGDPRAWSLLGWARLQEFFAAHAGEAAPADGTPAGLREARESFRRSLALDPDHPESLAGLGKTFLLGDEGLADGIAALAAAHRALPHRGDVILDLVALTARAGERERGWQILEASLRPLGDPELIGAAEDALLAAEVEEAGRLARLGWPQAARDRLQRAAARTSDPARRATLEARIEAFRQGEVRRGGVERFNAAVDAANRGELEAARAGLTAVRDGTADADLRRAAEEGLARIEAEIARRDWVRRFDEAVDLAAAGRLEEAARRVEELLRSPPDGDLARRARELGERLRKAQE